MSQELGGNYVGITEAPEEMFGKMMSIPDELMWSYYELVTDRTPKEIVGLKQEVASGALHPMDAKMRLAEEVVFPIFMGPKKLTKPQIISSEYFAIGKRLLQRRYKEFRWGRQRN